MMYVVALLVTVIPWIMVFVRHSKFWLFTAGMSGCFGGCFLWSMFGLYGILFAIPCFAISHFFYKYWHIARQDGWYPEEEEYYARKHEEAYENMNNSNYHGKHAK